MIITPSTNPSEDAAQALTLPEAHTLSSCAPELPPPETKLKAFDPKTADTTAYRKLRGETAEAWDNEMVATMQVARQTGLDAFIRAVDEVRTVGMEKGKAAFKTRYQKAFPDIDFTKPVTTRSTNATGEFVLSVEQDGKSYTSKDPAIIRAEALYAFLAHADTTGAREGIPKGFAPSAVEALRLRLHERKEFESRK